MDEFIKFANEQPTNITGYLETKIIDQGIGIDIRKKGEGLFTTFAFNKAGAD
jgi:hypothetical protein